MLHIIFFSKIFSDVDDNLLLGQEFSIELSEFKYFDACNI